MSFFNIFPSTKTLQLCFTIVLGFVLTSTSCEKLKPEPNPPSEPQLPAITTSGKNTFGCYINDNLFIPKGGIYYRAIEYPGYHTNNGRFGSQVLNQKDFEDWIYIYLYVNNIFEIGNYQINSNDICYKRSRDTIIGGNETSYSIPYYVDTTKTNLVIISRLDLTVGIVSGEFEFTAVNSNLQDTIKITQGRFDLKNLVVQP